MVKPTSDDPLAGVEDSILSPEEIAAAVAEAKSKFAADAKAKAKKELIASEMEKLKRVEGQKTGDSYKDEMIPVTVDLPEFTPHLVINGEPFWHGHTYTRPRHVVNSLREMISRAWNHQDDIDGKSMAQRLGAHRVKNWNSLEGARV